MFVRSLFNGVLNAAKRRPALWAWLVLVFACRALVADETSAPAVDFKRDVQPILAAHCHECHGPRRQEGGLRLSDRASALAGGDSGQKSIVPSDPAASRLLKVIDGSDGELKMPPEGEGQPLSAAQVDLLARWIRAGAAWPIDGDTMPARPDHWGWKKPAKAPLPTVKRADWPRHPLDVYVLARMEQGGLTPAPEADRFTLVRRVWLDLVGLPPAPSEVEAFVADTRADAYERMVDRALADPGYGERWARVWLDLARYADSKGYGSDPLRTIWRYRDWVIEAFNRNVPYDQFTLEQLAGDLLPNATTDQVLATAFHRNTMANDEGGTDDEEFRVAAVKDRIETTMQVWMGLTMGCAKCHSHKFDPITQREYYQAYAIFDQTEDADRGDEEPRMATPTRLDVAHVMDLRGRLAAVAAESEQHLEYLREIDALEQVVFGLPAAVLRAQVASLERQIRGAEQQAPLTPVLRELPIDKRRATRIMVKGNFKSLGDAVEPGLPAAFHDWPTGAPRNRIGLAQWLVDPENPLTARVAVNRLWAQVFGAGIVVTEEDFGTQGLPPSQPEVLDWLAVAFVEGDWNIKDILRQMVCSATYRQSSTPAPESLQKDPNNVLLSHGPRHRLEAEMVRDQALAISGLLSRRQLGPSVYPPQPDGLWRAAFNGQRTWPTSTGDDRYRRGLYTFWRRTVPYPSMATFDAPSREICSMRRIATNTPLQAFVTMNDPAFVEAAQALGRRMVAEGGATTEERCRFGLRLALVRMPEPAHVAALVSLFDAQRAQFNQDSAAALSLATEPLGPLPAEQNVADMAAWTVVSNVILNLDGVLTKR